MKLSNESGFRSTLRKAWRARFRAGREEGSTLFEFAVVLPVLSMVLIGIIYGGIMFYDNTVLANAVAVGARTLATSAGMPTNACTLAETALTNAAYSLNPGLITINNGPGTETFTTPAGIQGGSTCTALKTGETATMTATYACNLTIPFANINLCPVASGTLTEKVPTGVGTDTVTVTLRNCPHAYCVSATTAVQIE